MTKKADDSSFSQTRVCGTYSKVLWEDGRWFMYFCATTSNIKYGVIWGEEGNIHKSFIRALTFQDKRKRVGYSGHYGEWRMLWSDGFIGRNTVVENDVNGTKDKKMMKNVRKKGKTTAERVVVGGHDSWEDWCDVALFWIQI